MLTSTTCVGGVSIVMVLKKRRDTLWTKKVGSGFVCRQ